VVRDGGKGFDDYMTGVDVVSPDSIAGVSGRGCGPVVSALPAASSVESNPFGGFSFVASRSLLDGDEWMLDA